MKKAAQGFLNKLTQGRNLQLPAERLRLGIFQGWLSVAANLIIATVKFISGLLIGSISLLADAVHTASDISSSLMVLIGFRASQKEPDAEHPYGHGRIEYLTGLIISLMLIGAGVSFIYTSYDRLITGSVIQPSLPVIVIVLSTILIKEFLYHFATAAGKKIDSEALIADAMHHRSDSLTTLAVLLAVSGSYFNLYYLDSIFGFVVSIYIVYSGLKIARSSINRILGTAPCEETRRIIFESVLETCGVNNAHDLEVHDYGAQKSVTVHIEVDGNLSVNEAHDIAESVENKLWEKNRCFAVVHLDPCPKSVSGSQNNKSKN